MQSIMWLIVLAVLLVIELVTVGLVTVWFAVGALVAFLISLAADNLILQLAAFLVVSILMLIFTRPVLARLINGRRAKTNVDSVIGTVCIVTEEIDNLKETGTVRFNGLEWTARSSENTVIAAGAKVKVSSVSGVKVFVEEVK